MGLIAPSISTESGFAPGFVGRIPVRNLWLLMLYASDLFRLAAPPMWRSKKAQMSCPIWWQKFWPMPLRLGCIVS